MALDALRGYVQLASGLTEVTRRRAVDEAKALLAQRPDLDQIVSAQADTGKRVSAARGQVQTLADELMATSKSNRDLLGAFVRAELERGVAALGLVRAEELDDLRARLARLEADSPTAPTASRSTRKPAKSASVKSTAKKSTAKKPAAKKAPAKTAATKSTPTTKKTAPKKTAPKTTRKTT